MGKSYLHFTIIYSLCKGLQTVRYCVSWFFSAKEGTRPAQERKKAGAAAPAFRQIPFPLDAHARLLFPTLYRGIRRPVPKRPGAVRSVDAGRRAAGPAPPPAKTVCLPVHYAFGSAYLTGGLHNKIPPQNRNLRGDLVSQTYCPVRAAAEWITGGNRDHKEDDPLDAGSAAAKEKKNHPDRPWDITKSRCTAYLFLKSRAAKKPQAASANAPKTKEPKIRLNGTAAPDSGSIQTAARRL